MLRNILRFCLIVFVVQNEARGQDCNVTSCGQSNDCNNNNIPDDCDISDGTSEDCNNNGVPDECDIDGGIVDPQTVLLLHADAAGSAFVDSSPYVHALTANGDAVQSASAAKFGVSGIALDGNGDFLSIPSSVDWNFGLGDFTIDFWVRPSNTDHRPALVSDRKVSGDHSGEWSLEFYTQPNVLELHNGFNVIVAAGASIPAGAWTHAAVVRAGGIVSIYYNGVLKNSAADGTNYNNGSALLVGRDVHDAGNLDGDFSGFIDELRISKGVARWTSPFTPPTSPYGSGQPSSNDCNSNGIPDECELTNNDCNNNGIPDECDLDRLAWMQRLPSNAPGFIGHHAIAYDSVRHETVLFGGYDGDPVDETWTWDGQTWSPRATGNPGGRWHHKMAFDDARGLIVLFGGHSGCCDDFGDTWEWDGISWTFRTTSGPGARFMHAMAYDSARQRTVVFGGFAGEHIETRFGDTWEWDGNTWMLRATTGPSPRGHGSMVYDIARGVCVLFGGGGGGPLPLGDTWEWDGSAWLLRSTEGPSPRIGYGMSYDNVRHVTVLFGGHNGTSYLGDTWEWDGAAWTQRMISGPSPRGNPAAFDASRNELVLFGSVEGGIGSETWVLRRASLDCNGNGVPDECEPDCDQDGVIDACDLCGDLDNDSDVDGTDFSAFLLAFGAATGQPGFLACADSDGDGITTLVDYQAWLACYRVFVGDPQAHPPQPDDLGDMNADGRVDGLDIQAFIQTLIAPRAASFRSRIVADFNADSQANIADTEGFITKLLGAQ